MALGGITFFLTEHLRVVSLRQNQTRAIYLAQAGLMRAIFDFRYDGPGGVGVDSNNIRLGTYDAVPGDQGQAGWADDDVFILTGHAADFLLAAMIPAGFASGGAGGACGSTQRRRLQAWTLRNVLISDTPPNGLAVQFQQMAVSWWPVGAGEGLIRIDLDGTSSDWTATGCVPQASGTVITLGSLQTVGANDPWNTNRLWFAAPTLTTMDGKQWIEVAFFMNDNSVRRARFRPSPNQRESSASFTIKSIGEVRSAPLPFVASRRLQAEYRLNDDDLTVTNFSEVGSILSDTALQRATPAPAGDQRPGYHEIPVQQP